MTDFWSFSASKAVCLECVVDPEHEYSYIGSYSSWLDNADQQSICPLTQHVIEKGDEVVRLMDLKLYTLSAVSNKSNQVRLYPALPDADDECALAHHIRGKLQNINWISDILRTKEIISKPDKTKRKKEIGDIVITMDKNKPRPVTRRVRNAFKRMQLKKLIQSFLILCVILSICYCAFKYIVFDYSSEKVGSDENLAFLLQNLEKI